MHFAQWGLLFFRTLYCLQPVVLITVHNYVTHYSVNPNPNPNLILTLTLTLYCLQPVLITVHNYVTHYSVNPNPKP